MAISQPVCPNCNVEMRCRANDIPLIHESKSTVFYGDIWQCPLCTHVIATGLGDPISAIAEGYHHISKKKYITFRTQLPYHSINWHQVRSICLTCKQIMDIRTRDICVVHFTNNDRNKGIDAYAEYQIYACNTCNQSVLLKRPGSKTELWNNTKYPEGVDRWLSNRYWVEIKRSKCMDTDPKPANIQEATAESILGSSIWGL